MQETGCNYKTLSITYYSDTNCQNTDLEMTQQEQLKMLTKGKDLVLDGACHDILGDHTTTYLRAKQVADSSVRFTCTDETYSEAWYLGENCAEAELFVDLTATWGSCMVIGDVSFKATR
jgi:hypothetical protein